MKRAALVGMVILVCGSAAFGQWIDQQSNFPNWMYGTSVSPVNAQVAWVSMSGAPGGTSSKEWGWYCRTLDGGNTWTSAVAPIPASRYIVNISAVSADTAWISVSGSLTGEGNGFYRTIDGGKNWVLQSSGLSEAKTYRYFIHFYDADDGLAVFQQDSSGYCPIYYTRDGGTSWTRVADSDNAPMLPNEFPGETNFCRAGEAFYWGTSGTPSVPGRFFRSTDRGKSWSVIQTPFNSGYTSIFPSFKDSMNGLVLATGPDHPRPSIGVTHDGGATWQPAAVPDMAFSSCVSIPGTEAGYMVCGAGSAFTLDNGATWTQIDNVDYWLQAFASRTIGWCGVFNTTLIRKWQIGPSPAINSYPLKALDFGRIRMGQESPSQSLSVTNYGQDPLIITEALIGASFKLAEPFLLPRTLQSLETARLRIAAVPAAAGMLSDSLVFVSNALPSSRHAIHLQVEGVVIEPAQPECLYTATAKALYTMDPASGSATKIADINLSKINNLVFSPRTRELLGVTSASDKTEINAICAISGKTAPLQTIPAVNMRALAFKADTLYGVTLAGDFYCIHSVTGEASLISKAPGIKYYGLAVHPVTGEFYASAMGATKDLIVKINPATGDTTLVGNAGGNVIIFALNFSPSGQLYGLKATTPATLITIDPATGVGTNIGPVNVSSLQGLAWSSKVTGVEEIPAVVAVREFALRQNYPNPFNAQTSLEVSLSTTEQVDVSVFNLLGEPVATLHHGLLQAGKHTLVWTGKSDAEVQVSSGIYMIRMTAPGFLASRKVLLLR